MSFEQKLKRYAEVIVKIGLNLQPGQKLLIKASIEAKPFVRLVTEYAYKQKSKLVSVLWEDRNLDLIRIQNASCSSLKEYEKWKIDLLIEAVKRGDSILNIISPNPDLFKDVDPKLIAFIGQSAHKHTSEFQKYLIRNKTNWCKVAVPNSSWAEKVFPNLPLKKRLPALWNEIFRTSRINNPNPVLAWRKHINELSKIINYLNIRQYISLKFVSPDTDLTIGLPKKHIWAGGIIETKNNQKIKFTPNIPTEEIFTLPHRKKVNGVVASSKPLNYGGVSIEHFFLTFKNGKIMKVKAKKNEKILKKIIKTDEGSRRLGEVALVPNSSSVSKSGLIFYSDLFDENAATHLALGKALRVNIKNGFEMSEKSFLKAGGNISLIHIDFMIGSNKMDVFGVKKDKKIEPIMKKGEWVLGIK